VKGIVLSVDQSTLLILGSHYRRPHDIQSHFNNNYDRSIIIASLIKSDIVDDVVSTFSTEGMYKLSEGPGVSRFAF